jgi:hypothetical protein
LRRLYQAWLPEVLGGKWLGCIFQKFILQLANVLFIEEHTHFRIIVPPDLGYPDNDYNKLGPKPMTFSVKRFTYFLSYTHQYLLKSGSTFNTSSRDKGLLTLFYGIKA